MGLIQWRKEYSIGVSLLDNQHKKIIHILNRLLSQQVHERNQKETEEILNELQNYIVEHFKSEEAYMLKHQFSGYEEQRKEHNQFIDRFFDARKEFCKNGRLTSVNLLNFVWDWFSQHLLKLDKQLSRIG